jgi:16S rRNA U1498 N3-methylase RsmE
VLRLFVPSAHREGPLIRVTGNELRHLRTLRLGAGARLVVFDERSRRSTWSSRRRS